MDKCEGLAKSGQLCGRCHDLRDSAIIIGVCFGMCALIVAMARVGGML